VQITLVGVTGGIVFGSLLAIARLSRNRIISTLATSYVNLMRSIPLILVIFWVFFLVPWAIGWVTRSGRPVAVGASLTIFVTFVLFEAAYYAEIVRAGFRSISPGQYSACDALGLSKFHAYVYILFPQAIRNVLPDLVSNTVEVVKLTSIASVVALPELLYSADMARSVTFNSSPIVLAAAIYLVMLWPIVRLVSMLERRIAA